LELGIEAKYLNNQYDNWYGATTDVLGNSVAELTINKKVSGSKWGGFINLITKPFPKFSTTLGLRSDVFTYNKNKSISPRFSFSYQLGPNTTLNGATGLYYQNLPLLLLSQNENFKNLKDPFSAHYVLGVDHLLNEDTKLSFELYWKDYKNFPLDPHQPGLFLLDEIYYRYTFFGGHDQLVDEGEAVSKGVEFMLQKKLAQNIYGLISVSHFRSKYKDHQNEWKNRIFDNQLIFSIQGGYKPNKNWEVSIRWMYAGGSPYTPFDLEASKQNHRVVLDGNRINEARYPDYHSMNLRFDKRFYFMNSNLVFYFSVWNVYNRKNIATYFWNDKEQKQDEIYQWRFLPIFGLEYEF
jgi:hypothetical protein